MLFSSTKSLKGTMVNSLSVFVVKFLIIITLLYLHCRKLKIAEEFWITELLFILFLCMRQFQKRLKELGIRWKRMSNWRSEHSSLSLLKYILYDILSHDFLHQTQNFELIDLLFSFLEPTCSHSALLAGYFTKVCSSE